MYLVNKLSLVVLPNLVDSSLLETNFVTVAIFVFTIVSFCKRAHDIVYTCARAHPYFVDVFRIAHVKYVFAFFDVLIIRRAYAPVAFAINCLRYHSPSFPIFLIWCRFHLLRTPVDRH